MYPVMFLEGKRRDGEGKGREGKKKKMTAGMGPTRNKGEGRFT
jgi:hypothetical protein